MDESEAGSGAARLRGCRPTRPAAEVIDLVIAGGRGGLLGIVRGPSDQHVRSDDLPGHGQRQVILAQV
ncbi:Uncharacterised protein [Mycobacteroides abscessus subsp. massiliense]|nr:Uncharacterised protein [Mycobacteroides abscessus subsp. massiliense]